MWHAGGSPTQFERWRQATLRRQGPDAPVPGEAAAETDAAAGRTPSGRPLPIIESYTPGHFEVAWPVARLPGYDYKYDFPAPARLVIQGLPGSRPLEQETTGYYDDDGQLFEFFAVSAEAGNILMQTDGVHPVTLTRAPAAEEGPRAEAESVEVPAEVLLDLDAQWRPALDVGPTPAPDPSDLAYVRLDADERRLLTRVRGRPVRDVVHWSVLWSVEAEAEALGPGMASDVATLLRAHRPDPSALAAYHARLCDEGTRILTAVYGESIVEADYWPIEWFVLAEAQLRENGGDEALIAALAAVAAGEECDAANVAAGLAAGLGDAILKARVGNLAFVRALRQAVEASPPPGWTEALRFRWLAHEERLSVHQALSPRGPRPGQASAPARPAPLRMAAPEDVEAAEEARPNPRPRAAPEMARPAPKGTAALEADIAALEAMLTTLSADRDQLLAERDGLVAYNEALQGANDSNAERMGALLDALAEAEAKVSDLEGELTKLRARKNRAVRQRKAAQADADQIRTHTEALRAELADTAAARAEAEANHSSAEAAHQAVRLRLREAESANRALRSAAEKDAHTIRRAEVARAEWNRQIEALRAEVGRLQQAHATSESARRALEAAAAELERSAREALDRAQSAGRDAEQALTRAHESLVRAMSGVVAEAGLLVAFGMIRVLAGAWDARTLDVVRPILLNAWHDVTDRSLSVCGRMVEVGARRLGAPLPTGSFSDGEIHIENQDLVELMWQHVACAAALREPLDVATIEAFLEVAAFFGYRPPLRSGRLQYAIVPRQRRPATRTGPLGDQSVPIYGWREGARVLPGSVSPGGATSPAPRPMQPLGPGAAAPNAPGSRPAAPATPGANPISEARQAVQATTRNLNAANFRRRR